jgi:glycerol-3-phosphate cytidylyltransferase
MKKVIITYGTYDLFHVGHVRLLKRLKLLGDTLIVGCSTDEFNHQKGKKTIMPYSHRAEILDACKYVDIVFPEESWEQKINDIKKYKADIFSMGDDWIGHFDELEEYCEVIYIPRTGDISTTELRETINLLHREKIDQISHLAENLLLSIKKI